ncbi:MAG: DUF4760 domain-containing protein [Acidimicrobiales bacterium]
MQRLGQFPPFGHPFLPAAGAHPGTDWSAVTAWATIVVAAGIVAAAVGAAVAARQLKESKKSRYSSLFMEMAKAWDEDDLVVVRQSLKGMDPHSFRDHYFSQTRRNSKEFYGLLKLGNFFEYFGILEDRDGLHLELIETALGNSVLYYWELYQVAIDEEAKGWPDFYKNWRHLADKLRQRHPTRPRFFPQRG